MKAFNWFYLVFIIYFSVNTDAGPKCFDCTRIPFPRDCNHVTECGNHEVCHTKQIVSQSGHVFYNTGCWDKAICTNSKRHVINDTLFIADDESHDIITCSQCCHGDYCNTHGCSSEPIKPYPNERGPLCFNCQKGTALPGDCETVVVCSRDEHCSIEETVGIGGDKLYLTGCKKCDTGNFIIPVGKRNAKTCSGCCQTEFCNNDCNSVTSSSAITSTPSIIPTRKTTVAMTTKQSTEQTTKTTYTQSLPLPTPTMVSKEKQCMMMGYKYLKQYDNCFKPYSNVSLPWQQARDKCIQDGGDLVVFHDKQEETFLETWFLHLTSVTSRYWVGASDLGHEGTWLWVDSTAVDTKLYFHPGEPNDAGYPEGFHENCAAATYFADQTRRILLNDDNCSLPSNFICEISLAKSCPDTSYLHFSVFDMCFKIYTTMLTWQHANDKCHSEHAKLVEINTIKKIKFFDHLLRNVPVAKDQYWVGGKQSQSDPNAFLWQTTKQTIAQELWHEGEPNSASEQCVSIHYYNSQDLDRLYRLNDLNCNNLNAFICQYTW